MLPKVLKEKEWVKNWSGSWSLLFASFYGYNYTERLKKLTGKKFDNNLIISENNTTSNYLPQDELDALGKSFSRQIEREGRAVEWSQLVFDRTDEVLSLIKSLKKKKTFKKEDYYALRDAYHLHVPPNFVIKKVADYLPKSLLDNHMELFSKVRIYTEPVYGEIDRMLIKTVESLTKLPKKLVPFITKWEIEEYLESGKLISKEVLEERINGCAILFNKKGEETFFSSKDLKDLNKQLIGKTNIKEIKGQIAFKGIVKGTVRIIFDPYKYKIFSKGDILVTGMTRPEYLQLMQKSGAFVTDAGGLLSHAAIVARELKKPCIIGTKIATKVLKDGDLVEVDAEKGIVTILKKR